jgi:hypothetical protein
MNCVGLPLPNETIYSWCGFQHSASCAKSAAGSALEMTGSAQATRQIDLPPYLARLPFLNAPSVANVVKVLRSHTVGAYYWPYLPDSSKQLIVDEIIGEQDRHWRHLLCSPSRIRPLPHPLRWCPRCADVDESTCGRAYWHVDHQLPLSYACAEHHLILHVARPQPKTWIFVRTAILDWSLSPTANTTIGILAAQLGRSISGLESISIPTLRRAAVLRLHELGVILSANGTQHRRITGWFQQSAVAKWCLAAPYGLSMLASGVWIAGLLWRRRTSHPIFWAVLWMALHETETDVAVPGFLSAARGLVLSAGGQIELFPEETLPLSAPAHVRKAFMASSSYAEVMGLLDATRGDIVRWLEIDQTLRNDWRGALRLGRQAQCEAILIAATRDRPDLNRRYLVENHGTELRWLQEHAPALLRMLLRSLPGKGEIQTNIFDVL